MATEQEIIKGVTEYIEESKTSHAMLIDGPWGSGKTRFIKRELKPDLEGGDNPYVVIRVSLFGVSGADELFSSVINAAVNEYAAIEEDVSGSRSKDLIKIVREAGVSSLKNHLKRVVKKAGVHYSAPSKLVASLMCGKRTLIVFDDVERRGDIDNDELFGAINDLIETQQRKVLLVANNQAAGKKIPNEIMEKLVWPVFLFSPNKKNLIKGILEEHLKEYPLDINAKEILCEVLEELGHNNARAIQKTKDLFSLLSRCSFSSDEGIDGEVRRTTLRDVWSYALDAARGITPDVPDPKEEAEQSFADILPMQEQRDKVEQFAALPFLASYFEGNQTLNIAEVNLHLVEYAKKYHPESECEKRAVEAIKMVPYAHMDDEGMLEAKESILDALERKKLSIANFPDCIRALALLKMWGFVKKEEWLDARDKIEQTTSSDVVYSHRVFCVKDYFWNHRCDNNEILFSTTLDQLREDIRSKYDSACEESAWHIDTSSPDSGSELASLMQKEKDCNRLRLSRFPEEVVSQCVASSDIDSLIRLRRIMLSLRDAISVHCTSDGDEAWFGKVIGLIRQISLVSKMRKLHIDLLIEHMKEIRDKIKERDDLLLENR